MVRSAVWCAVMAGAASGDVEFVRLSGSIHYQGLIGGGADVLQWNQTVPFGSNAPVRPTNGGAGFSGAFFNDGDVNGNPFTGSADQSVSVSATYTFNQGRGFAIASFASIAMSGGGSGPVVVGANGDLYYDYVFTTSAPTAFRVVASGTYSGVWAQSSLRTENGPNHYWSLFYPDGLQSHDITGVLPQGTHHLYVSLGVSIGINQSGSQFSDVLLTVGAACPADFNGDGFIDGFDYDEYVDAFETGDMAADTNGDGFLDGFDYDDFVTIFELGCGF